MKIGLTYDLRSWYIDRGYSMEDTAEFDKKETVDALDDSLVKMGFETEQIGNSFQMIEALAGGKRWELVFNIAEGLYGDGRESVINAIQHGKAKNITIDLSCENNKLNLS